MWQNCQSMMMMPSPKGYLVLGKQFSNFTAASGLTPLMVQF
jgi:hypothetical protein